MVKVLKPVTLLPSFAAAVMVTSVAGVPETTVTTPEEFTEAIPLSLEDQSRLVFVAVAGSTVTPRVRTFFPAVL
jgi:hypothetical protein